MSSATTWAQQMAGDGGARAPVISTAATPVGIADGSVAAGLAGQPLVRRRS
jgi:hypothetical protein